MGKGQAQLHRQSWYVTALLAVPITIGRAHTPLCDAVVPRQALKLFKCLRVMQQRTLQSRQAADTADQALKSSLTPRATQELQRSHISPHQRGPLSATIVSSPQTIDKSQTPGEERVVSVLTKEARQATMTWVSLVRALL